MNDITLIRQSLDFRAVISTATHKKKVHKPLKKLAFACAGLILRVTAFSFRSLFGRIFIDLW